MSRATIESHYGAFIVRGALVQSDWDFPATAESLGWSLQRVQRFNGSTVALARRAKRSTACRHNVTDGTVDCGCGVTASDFINAARAFLDSIAT